MSAPSVPPDNSAKIERMRLDAEQRRRDEENAKVEAHKQELAGLRTNAATAGTSNARQYFQQQGLDPDEYSNDINTTISSILAGINPTDENPAQYFNDAGSRIFNDAQTGYRTKSTRAVDNLLPANFELQRVPWTLDDPYLAGIEEEKFAGADEVIRNMLDRGVINTSGYESAKANLEGQRAGARSRLNEIGTGTLASQQQALRDIANRGRQTASSLALGSQFDPYSYTSEIDQNFGDFLGRLGDTLRGKIPGDLFSTAGLAAVAGRGQGAQNTNFDPAALAGIFGTDDEEDPNAPKEDEEATRESIF